MLNFFDTRTYDEIYTNKITDSSFIQSNIQNSVIKTNTTDSKKEKNIINKYKFLFDCLLFTNDPESLFNINREEYIDKKKMQLATDIDEKSQECYDVFNYRKNLKKN